MKHLKFIFLLIGVLLLTSCRQLLASYYFKNPRVENPKTITSFLDKNKFSKENSFYKSYDSLKDVKHQLFSALSEGYHVFDRNGNLYCYNGEATCSGVQFKNLLDENQTQFVLCKNDSLTLPIILNSLYDLNDQKAKMEDLPQTEYYIVHYWAKFVGGAWGYKENVEWIEDKINEKDLSDSFTLLKVNTDFNERSGFNPKKKGKIKIKIDKEGGKLTLEKLPR